MPNFPQGLYETFDVGDGRFPGRGWLPKTTLSPLAVRGRACLETWGSIGWAGGRGDMGVAL